MQSSFFNPGGGASAAVQLPIGCVVAWLKSYPNCPPLPANFVECNGQTLNDTGSVFSGQTIPDLNGNTFGNNRFLRGSTASGGVGGTLCHTHTGSGMIGPMYGNFNTTPPTLCAITAASISSLMLNYVFHEPPYYNVVWIMRVK